MKKDLLLSYLRAGGSRKILLLTKMIYYLNIHFSGPPCT